ncbi:hypothetical protein MXB_953, partial [Myxobolus squamalis]
GTQEEFDEKLKHSTTLYVGNLSFYSEETQIYTLFNFIGPVKNVIIGLNRYDKTPCGFCFVEYYERCHADNAVKYFSGCVLDGRSMSVDIDAGYEERGGYNKFVKIN